ncbi:MAG: DNA mismatch repair endonuclease MutL [Clostridiales bacterium]|nr:DNA mismatch repair endonuclease MutL [Clostridiales bacterium]
MPKINLLPKEIAELIAAGEVVERPSSVIKELVENSVDAGAKNITVEIKNGGKTFMRISDDGCGIERADIPLAVTSHATSKIKSRTDLDSIATLGFRGEALASVCAVSKVDILTKTAGEDVGTAFSVNGGVMGEAQDAGCPEGTTVVIRELFFKTPARMKFLKKDVSEANFSASVIDKIAIAYPEISFKFIRDGRQTLSTPGNGDMLSAVYAVYGREFAESLVKVSYSLDGVSADGYVSSPLHSRGSRGMQLFYINRRLISNRTAAAALEEAYKNSIMIGKFPACVLNISAPYESIDVNVHPAKTEVRFADERRIFNAVYYAVKNAIDVSPARPAVNIDARPPQPEPVEGEQTSFAAPQIKITHIGSAGSSPLFINSPERDGETAQESYTTPVFTDIIDINPGNPPESDAQPRTLDFLSDEPLPEIPQKAPANAAQVPDFRVIGEAFKTYILVECEEKLLVIDKHAAHERMLFEKMKSRGRSAHQQMLLKPVIVTFSKEEYVAVISASSELSGAGFDIKDFGDGSIKVSACPSVLGDCDVTVVLTEIAAKLVNNSRDISTDALERIYSTIACKAAIKAGQYTSDYERNRFVSELLANDEIRFCPHGRPVVTELSRHELEKQFKRIL